MKNLQKRIGNYIHRMRAHKMASALIAAAVCAAIIILTVCLVSCDKHETTPVYTGSGLYLEDDFWKRNEQGFLYYDREGYTNMFGIDISEWVEDIDFHALRSSGVEFVILRVGYRGYETGRFVLDSKLADYLKGASEAGLKTGAYIVSQAVNTQEAVEEAEYVLSHIRGYRMEMPIYIDLEDVPDETRTDSLTKKQRTEIVQAFCSDLESQGYKAGVYAAEYWFSDKLDLSGLDECDIWLAKYSDAPGTALPVNMWQFSNEGIVDGTDMWVDLNVRVSYEKETNG